jgi:hypothetical protein
MEFIKYDMIVTIPNKNSGAFRKPNLIHAKKVTTEGENEAVTVCRF